jgi:preprotein translocase subunit SecG
MELIKTLIHIINALSAFGVIVLVLLQHGKGADMGAAFGSGSAGSLFGSSGSANFLSRTTAVCATIFFCSLFGLVWLDNQIATKGDASVMTGVEVKAPVQGTQKLPVVPAQDSKQGSIPN